MILGKANEILLLLLSMKRRARRRRRKTTTMTIVAIVRLGVNHLPVPSGTRPVR